MMDPHQKKTGALCTAEHSYFCLYFLVVFLLDGTYRHVFCRFGGEEQQEENRVHLGNAIMSFYSALIDLLGRCAPEMHVSLS